MARRTRSEESRPSKVQGFGTRLARLRQAAGFTQTELAKAIGASQRMIAYYESESSRPPAHLLASLAEVLGTTVDTLLGTRPVKREVTAHDARLLRKVAEIEKLPAADRRVVIRVIDALLAQHRSGRAK